MRTVVLLFMWMCALLARAQDDGIYISVVQPERPSIPAEANELLSHKLTQLLTAGGVASTDEGSRFVLTVKANVLSKDMVPTTPQRVSERIMFTFLIGDADENKVFETATLTTRGIGINENKAFIMAVGQIQPSQKELQAFVSRAKEKITAYYSRHSRDIMAEARQQAAAGQYEEAIYQLMAIPRLGEFAEAVEQQLEDYGARWAEQRAETERRQEAARQQQYNDSVAHELRQYELALRQQSADNSARKQRIEAARQVGLAYAKRRPQTVVYRRNVYYW